LAEGNDFYGYARLSPDGEKLAWLTWNHPNMPWDGTELWIADVSDDGNLLNAKKVAGGIDESIFQPEWSPNSTLYFVSDKTDWWNLYRVTSDGVEQVVDRAAEFGVPQWVFGLSTYAIASEERIVCTFTEHGFWRLAAVDTVEKKLEVIETPYTYIEGIRATGERVVFRAASPTEFVSIVQLDLACGQLSVLKKSCDLEVDQRYISIPKPVEYPTENGLTAYGIYYPPHNADFCAPDGELPPLLVNSHGGPTGAYQAVLSLEIQYWTSRGFGVLLVNYGGSTGYGRSYRDRLKGNWGVIDVDDCVNGAKYLVEQGEVDVNRVVIAGGSAGGYTTVCALTFRDFFKAGASYFGISDLEFFARDTHKFESRYLDGLVGPYPERKDVYYERSATHFTDRLSCPIIFFQGLDDKIVPPNQSEIMVEALRKKGLPVAYLEFEGEGHGFRKAETLKRSLDAEFYFYARIFGFEPADEIEPVEIENL
jgi:dipeptidyl aminopeptidase/acylaminoacyl peptidase